MQKPGQLTPKEIAIRQERKKALEHARVMALRILKRRKGIPLPDISQVIEQIREERVKEIIKTEKS